MRYCSASARLVGRPACDRSAVGFEQLDRRVGSKSWIEELDRRSCVSESIPVSCVSGSIPVSCVTGSIPVSCVSGSESYS